MYTNFNTNPISFYHSNMAKITAHFRFCNLGHISITWAILHQMWIKLETNLFEYFHKIYIHLIHLLKVILWIYPTKSIQIWLLRIYLFNHLIASDIAYFIQFNQLICTQMKWSTRDIPWLAYDHPISKLQLIFLQAIK